MPIRSSSRRRRRGTALMAGPPFPKPKRNGWRRPSLWVGRQARNIDSQAAPATFCTRSRPWNRRRKSRTLVVGNPAPVEIQDASTGRPGCVYSSLTTLLCSFRGPLQFRNAGFDVLNFDSSGGVIENAIGCSDANRGWCARVHHDLHKSCGGCAGGLLQPGDRLGERLPARLPVHCRELRYLEPAQERSDSNPGGAARERIETAVEAAGGLVKES